MLILELTSFSLGRYWSLPNSIFFFLFLFGDGFCWGFDLIGFDFLASVVNLLILGMAGNLHGCFFVELFEVGVYTKTKGCLFLFHDFSFSCFLSFMEVFTRVVCFFVFYFNFLNFFFLLRYLLVVVLFDNIVIQMLVFTQDWSFFSIWLFGYRFY